MKILQKIKFQIDDVKYRQITLFGIPILEYKKSMKNNKAQKVFSLPHIFKEKDLHRVFYLKVHRVNSSTFDCIQQWVNIAQEANGYCYFICDKESLKNDIYKKIKFKNDKFEFIKTDKSSAKLVNSLFKYSDKVWKRIAYPMITAFIHAKKINCPISYNIDADDILILANPQKVAQALMQAEDYAKENKLDVFNFDMMVSKTFGVHWSFGIVMCLNPSKCLDVMQQSTNWNKNISKTITPNTNYLDKYNFNMDWLFSYFRDTKKLNMKTYYIENILVVHMPDIILKPFWSFMLQWKNGKITCPIFKDFYKDDFWGERFIYPECVKFDVGIKENDYITAAKNIWGYVDNFEYDMARYSSERNLVPNTNYTFCQKNLAESVMS